MRRWTGVKLVCLLGVAHVASLQTRDDDLLTDLFMAASPLDVGSTFSGESMASPTVRAQAGQELGSIPEVLLEEDEDLVSGSTPSETMSDSSDFMEALAAMVQSDMESESVPQQQLDSTDDDWGTTFPVDKFFDDTGSETTTASPLQGMIEAEIQDLEMKDGMQEVHQQSSEINEDGSEVSTEIGEIVDGGAELNIDTEDVNDGGAQMNSESIDVSDDTPQLGNEIGEIGDSGAVLKSETAEVGDGGVQTNNGSRVFSDDRAQVGTEIGESGDGGAERLSETKKVGDGGAQSNSASSEFSDDKSQVATEIGQIGDGGAELNSETEEASDGGAQMNSETREGSSDAGARVHYATSEDRDSSSLRLRKSISSMGASLAKPVKGVSKAVHRHIVWLGQAIADCFMFVFAFVFVLSFFFVFGLLYEDDLPCQSQRKVEFSTRAHAVGDCGVDIKAQQAPQAPWSVPQKECAGPQPPSLQRMAGGQKKFMAEVDASTRSREQPDRVA